MLRTGTAIVTLAVLLVPGAVSAQEDSRAEFERSRPEFDNMVHAVTTRRARLGVNVDLQAEATDTIGARLEGVTPGGPADKAGLRAGDVITHLDGEPLYTRRPASRRNGDTSLPGLRLIELAARLQPGDTVSVDYLRGSDRRKAEIVTSAESNVFTLRATPGRSVWVRPDGARGVAPTQVPFGVMMFASTLGQLELAPINEDLGRYFGVSEGVLVIDVAEDSDLKLRGGDVVLSVDGRKPNDPQHLLRILRSYEGGETVRLEVQRNQRRETITATIEERPAVRARDLMPTQR